MEGFVTILKRNRKRSAKKDSGFLQLFVSKRIIHGAATAILGIFVPIFLYETTGQQFWIVGGYYALLSFLYAVLLPPAMKVINRVGFSHTLILGGVFSVVLYSIMFFLNAENFWYLIIPLTIAIVGFRLFHWVPFHVDFALFTTPSKRAQQVSLSFAMIAFMGVVGPILAGFIVSNAGYGALFGTAVVLLIAATISYGFVPETKTVFEWGVGETWKKFTSPDMRALVTGEFANGAETVVNLIVWPIFLYEILNGDVFEIGAVSTVVVGATIVIQLLIGKHLDKSSKHKERTLQVGSGLYALGWIFKIFILSAAQVFFVGLFHNVVKIFTKTPYNTMVYDMTAEQGKYVDEFTVIKEISTHLGRACSLVVISLLALFIPIGWTFVIAAGASIALNLVYQFDDD